MQQNRRIVKTSSLDQKLDKNTAVQQRYGYKAWRDVMQRRLSFLSKEQKTRKL